MPQPTRGDVHVNKPLTNISIGYMQKARNFVAARVFPNVPVTKQGDRYFTYAKDDFFRDEMKERAPGTESAGSGYTVDNTPTYFAKVWALHKDLDDQTRANYDDPLSPDRDATNFLTQKGLIRREKLWVNSYFKTGVWGVDLTGVSGTPGAGQFKQWDQAGSTPVSDVQKQRIRIAETTGYMPNKLVIGPYVWLALSQHAEILDRIKYTQRGQITLDLLASLFDVDEVLVPFGTENTAIEGAAGSYSFITGKHALLVYAAPAPSLMEPTGGYTFSWTGWFGAGPEGNRIKRFRMEELESDRVEIQMAFDMKLVSSDVATFYSGAVA